MEGRRSTDVILAMCSTSSIIASGIAKDIGLKVMDDWGVTVFWMPACVGLAFTPLLMLGTWLLHQIPEPRCVSTVALHLLSAVFKKCRNVLDERPWALKSVWTLSLIYGPG